MSTRNKIERFEDLEVWKKGMQLAVAVYEQLAGCRDFGLRDQMQRAAVSTPSNIAEGYERGSNKEFIQYLFIAKGSAGELRTQLYLALKLKVLAPAQAKKLLAESRQISAMLARYITVRKTRF
jgi:four helix bundle protein